MSTAWQQAAQLQRSTDLGQVLDGGRVALELSCGFLTDWIYPLVCSRTGTYCSSHNAWSEWIGRSKV